MQTIIELNDALVWTGAAQEIEAGAGVPDHWIPVAALPTLAEGEYLIVTGAGHYEIRSGTPPVPRVDKVTRRQFLQGLTRIGLRALPFVASYAIVLGLMNAGLIGDYVFSIIVTICITQFRLMNAGREKGGTVR